MSRVLVVDDELPMRRTLDIGLRASGYDVELAATGEEALELAGRREPDAVILDLGLPGVDGIHVAQGLRGWSAVPIIVLSARGTEAVKVAALDAGADDYVTKPFSPSELIARLRAVLRRSHPERDGETLQYQDLVMDLASHRVRRNGREVHLGPTEFRLLRHLLENQGRVFSREQLLDMVWGRDVYVEPRTVDVHIRRLRKAINGEEETDLIRTVRAAGYALDLAE